MKAKSQIITTVALAATAALTVTAPAALAARRTHHRSATVRAATSVQPVEPGAMLFARGRLYVVDDTLNEVLARQPNGHFKVVAGDGRRGFSGDGGPATKAELNNPGGIAMSANGTLYIADTGNNRIRAVSRKGTITTVAGDGHQAWVANNTAATSAPLADPSSVALGPGGSLLITTFGSGQVLELHGRKLTDIAGARSSLAGVTGIGKPAIDATIGAPNGVAYGPSGNTNVIYISDAATKTLLMIDPQGNLQYAPGVPAGSDYPHTSNPFAAGPAGRLYTIDGRQEVMAIGQHNLTPVFTWAHYRKDGVRGFLPNGIAVARNGTIYLDTDKGNGYTNRTAIIQIPTSYPKHSNVIWKSR